MPRFPSRSLLPLLVLSLMLAGLAGPVTAQGPRTFYGLSAGATLGDFTDDFGTFDTETRWGATFGLILGVRTANWAAIALEPAWIQMGGADTRIDYLEVPLTLGGVARSPDDRMRYGAYVGIAPAFKLSCDNTDVRVACDEVNSSLWTLPLGARFLRRVNPTTFMGLDVRYYLPLGSSFDGADINQRTWAFRLVMVRGAP